MGTPRMSLKLRRVFVNTCLLLMLLFFSSPLAVISAAKSAGRIINAEAMDNAQLWLAWVQSSSWLASLIFQFLPNVIRNASEERHDLDRSEALIYCSILLQSSPSK